MGGRCIPTCWWCGENDANSKEHRHKRTRMSALFDQYPDTDFFYLYGENSGKLVSPKGKPIKFGRTMCRTCNSSRSSHFDEAYDRYMEFIFSDYERFRDNPNLDWREVYDGYRFDQRHLARYYVKNMCCRIVDDGFEVPRALIDYLDDIHHPAPLDQYIVKDYTQLDAWRKIGVEWIGASVNQASVPDTADQGDLTVYQTKIQDGPICYVSQWRSGREHSAERYSFTDRPVVQVLDRYDDFHDNNQFHEMNDRVAQINAVHTLLLTVAHEEARRGGLADYSMDDLEGMTVKQIQEAVDKSLQDRHKG